MAFLSLVASFRVVAALDRARRQRRVLHLWPARQQRALRLLVVAARRVDHKRPALFLSRCPFHPEARRWVAADARAHDGRMHSRRLVTADCRIADLRVPCRDLVAEYSQHHPRRDLDSHQAFAPAAGHVLQVIPRHLRG